MIERRERNSRHEVFMEEEHLNWVLRIFDRYGEKRGLPGKWTEYWLIHIGILAY